MNKYIKNIIEAFDFNSVKNSHKKQMNIVDDMIIPVLKTMKKGDPVYYDSTENTYYIGEQRKPYHCIHGYCAITSEESPDGIPRIISPWDLKDVMNNYDTLAYGGKFLIVPETDKDNGFKNTQELYRVGGKSAKENKAEYLDKIKYDNHRDYELWPVNYPFQYFAAKLCAEYSNDRKGKWYLPAINELILAFNTEDAAKLYELDYCYYSTNNFTLDSPLLASSTLVDDKFGKIVQMFHPALYHEGESLVKMTRTHTHKCNTRAFIKVTDLFNIPT
jgi:hypothetical protein